MYHILTIRTRLQKSQLLLLPAFRTCFTILLLQCSFFFDLLICLDLIIGLEAVKALQSNTAFGALAHFLDILLDVFQCINITYSHILV